MNRPAVLVIGGADSSGGAGIVRDAQVLAACATASVYAVTAVTAQTSKNVVSIHHVPPHVVRQQIRAALDTDDVRAVKIGMLGTAPTVEAVVRELPSRDTVPIVVDPVLAATSGGVLLDETGRDALRTMLLPRITLLTPNIPEAAMLLGESPAEAEADLAAQGRRLRELGPTAVLIKGGHGRGAHCVDLLVSADGATTRLASPRVAVSPRGTGCALSSAIAAALAGGATIAAACAFAKPWLSARIAAPPPSG